jgi:hypothetical protein
MGMEPQFLSKILFNSYSYPLFGAPSRRLRECRTPRMQMKEVAVRRWWMAWSGPSTARQLLAIIIVAPDVG